MIRKIYISCLVIALVGVIISCQSPVKKGLDLGKPAKISKAQPSASVAEAEDIRLKVFLLKETVELGEPVYLAVHVINEMQKPLSIAAGLKPGDGMIEVYATDPNGEMIELPPMAEGDMEGTIILKPGQVAGTVFPIFFGANGWNFKMAGKYSIKASLKIPDEDGFSLVRSEPAVLNVISSSAGKELLAKSNTQSIEAGKFLLWRSGDHLVEGIRSLRLLAEEHPSSVLSSYIFSAQAYNYSEPFANYLKGELRSPVCGLADSLRKMINPDVLPENLLIEDFISRAKCYAGYEDWDMAKAALDSGAVFCKDRPEFQAYCQSIKEMQDLLMKYLE